MNLGAAANLRDARALRLIRWSVWGPGSHEAPLSSEDVLWARREGLLPLLASHVSRGRVRAVASVQPALAAERRTCLARNLFLSTRLDAFLEALTSAGIPVMSLKGDALLRVVYPDHGARGMQDIDILVAPKDWDGALACAARLESKDVTPGAGVKDVTRRAFFQVALVFPWGGMVDMHRSLLPATLFPIPAAGLFERSQVVEARRVPAPEDLFLHVALHAAKDGFLVKGRDLVDALLLRESGLVAPARVLERATSWRARRATAVWLRALERFGTVPLGWVGMAEHLDPASRSCDGAYVLGASTWEQDPRRSLFAKVRLLASLDDRSRALRYLGAFGMRRIGDRMIRFVPRRVAVAAMLRPSLFPGPSQV